MALLSGRSRSITRDLLACPGELGRCVRQPTPAEARTALATLRLGFGVGWLAPDAVAKAFGFDSDRQESLAVIARLFAARDAMLGAGLLQSEGEDVDRWLRWGIAVNVADATTMLLGGLRRRVSWRSALAGAAVAGTAIYLGVVARRG